MAKYYRVSALAKKWGITKDAVYKMIRAGRLPVTNMLGWMIVSESVAQKYEPKNKTKIKRIVPI